MDVAITDACIFIDLLECEGHEAFFRLPYRIITSYQVWMELDEGHRSVLSRSRLEVLELTDDFVTHTEDLGLSQSLSIADRSVWYLAKDNEAILLTSDKVLRRSGNSHSIETHGLLWIFDQLVENQIIDPETAKSKLEIVLDQNTYYKTNEKLMKAYAELIDKWENF